MVALQRVHRGPEEDVRAEPRQGHGPDDSAGETVRDGAELSPRSGEVSQGIADAASIVPNEGGG